LLKRLTTLSAVTTEPTPAHVEGSDSPRRPATDDEARAMASPIRLQILRVCLDGALTNKEIAAALGKDPASVLYHVRRLVDTGFLVAEPVRRGNRGSRERPYRATGKSWILDVVEARDRRAGTHAMFEAFVAEARAAGLENVSMMRLGVRLTPAEREQLNQRLHLLFDEYARRPPSPDGEPLSLFYAAHAQPRPFDADRPRRLGEAPGGPGGAEPPADKPKRAVPSSTSRGTIESDD
jgi:DNA-binding transcriptional ArsR family regulator